MDLPSKEIKKQMLGIVKGKVKLLKEQPAPLGGR